MNRSKFFHSIFLVIIIAGLGLGFRAYAAKYLSIDYDEPVYLEAALEYSNYIREGKYSLIAWSNTNYEHPSLYKIIYGGFLLTQPPLEEFYESDLVLLTPMMTSQAVEYGMAGRWLSVIFGTITVALTALVNPVAGFFAAANTLSVKYTSQVYLESLPLLTSFLSILAYLEFIKVVRSEPFNNKKPVIWLGASAVFLGITAASKFVYCIAGLVIVIHLTLSVGKKDVPAKYLLWLMGWGLFSVASFLLFNPYLWPHPIERFIDSVNFHLNYPTTKTVAQYDYPWWQPLRWLYRPFKYFDPRPTSAFLIQIDPIIFGLAVIGLPRTYKKQFIYFLWLVLGLATLLLWGTKWPQYVMIIMVPYTIVAAQGATVIMDFGKSILHKLKLSNQSV